MDATAKPLLYLCRRRACLLRTALMALVPATTVPDVHMREAEAIMSKIDFMLSLIEADIESQKERADGQHSD